MPRRDIPHYHEFVTKDERPQPGATYHWYLGDEYVYTARVIEFRGGCWAHIELVKPAPKHAAVYAPGMSFEIKVAHYRIEPADV
ncbi:MAG: hypothetical protein N2663_06840 [Chlorobi bacterium]|nr:hypothetical protein [Chlorobiota bacterium]